MVEPFFLKVNPKTYAPVTVPDVLDRYKYLAFRKFDLLGLKSRRHYL